MTGYTLFDVSQRLTLPLYALIDPLQYPDLPEFWHAFQPRAAGIWATLRFDDAMKHWQHSAPMVVLIEEGMPGETLLKWLQDHQPARHAGVILMHGALSLDDITRHWQQRMYCTWPQGTRALFRCWSPAVLLPWWRSLNPDEQQAFCGAIAALYLPLSGDNDPACRYGSLTERSRKSSVDNYHITLNANQFEALSTGNRYHRLANRLWLRASEHYRESIDIDTLEQRFISGIEIAHTLYPQATTAECESWSAHRWLLGSEYYLHPEFKSLIARYSLGKSIKTFKTLNEWVEDARKNYHRTAWMRGEQPDNTEN